MTNCSASAVHVPESTATGTRASTSTASSSGRSSTPRSIVSIDAIALQKSRPHVELSCGRGAARGSDTGGVEREGGRAGATADAHHGLVDEEAGDARPGLVEQSARARPHLVATARRRLEAPHALLPQPAVDAAQLEAVPKPRLGAAHDEVRLAQGDGGDRGTQHGDGEAVPARLAHQVVLERDRRHGRAHDAARDQREQQHRDRLAKRHRRADKRVAAAGEGSRDVELLRARLEPELVEHRR